MYFSGGGYVVVTGVCGYVRGGKKESDTGSFVCREPTVVVFFEQVSDTTGETWTG